MIDYHTHVVGPKVGRSGPVGDWVTLPHTYVVAYDVATLQPVADWVTAFVPVMSDVLELEIGSWIVTGRRWIERGNRWELRVRRV